MADGPKIESLEELEGWLTTQDERVSRAIATRASLRSLPALMVYQAKHLGTLSGNRLLLDGFMATLTAGVSSTCPQDKMASVEDIAKSAFANSTLTMTRSDFADEDPNADPPTKFAYPAIFAAGAAANALSSTWRKRVHYTSDISVEREAKSSILSSLRSSNFFTSQFDESGLRSVLSADLQDVQPKVEVEHVFSNPLWPEGNQTTELASAWNTFSVSQRNDEFWGFWVRWYDGMVRGKPMDWDLQLQIVLGTSDKIWRAGPEAVAEKIREIEAKFELEGRIAELEAELAEASANRLGIGGNNPPETIEDPAPTANELLVVWEPLQDLKQETQSETPDPSRVQSVIDRLEKALIEGAKWVSRKIDLAVDTAIKWAVPTALGYVVVNPGKLEAVIKAAQSWLATLL